MRICQVDQGDWIEQQAEVIVQVVVAVCGDEWIELPVRNKESRLIRGREVDTKTETRVLVRAHQQQEDRLHAEDGGRRVLGDTGEPDSAIAREPAGRSG